MTTFIIDLVQPATECNLGLTRRSPMAWTLAPGAPLAPSPLTAEGMAAYAGVMTMFTGTGDNDTADVASGLSMPAPATTILAAAAATTP